MSTTVKSPKTAIDPRINAFCRSDGPEIFRPIAYPTEVWTPDPFDVESIHAEARDLFAVLLDRTSDPTRQGPRVGRILLLLGEAGSGKTHLMRAFRTRAHALGKGYFGYMQMTTTNGNYCRYILHQLIESLDEPYYRTEENRDDTTGLMRLSNKIVDIESVSPDMLDELREKDPDPKKRVRLVNRMAEDAQLDPRLANQPLTLLKAMVFLQSGNPGIRSRTMQYLRGESLSPNDKELLDIAQAMDDDHLAEDLILRLGQLMWALDSAALVICLDQLEDVVDFDHAPDSFRRAMQGLTAIAAGLPNALLVVSCLEDYYAKLKEFLDRSALDRLEKDPPPLILQGHRTYEEIEELVAAHLKHLYGSFDVEFDSLTPIFPLPRAKLQELTHQTARTVLNWCKQFRETAIRSGTVPTETDVPFAETPATKAKQDKKQDPVPKPDPTAHLDQEWNDFLTNWTQRPPEKEDGLAQVLADAIEECPHELSSGHTFTVDRDNNQLLVLRSNGNGNPIDPLRVGVCNRTPSGGHLGRQIEQVLQCASPGARHAVPVIVRSTEYRPKSGEIAKTFAKLYSMEGRYFIVSDSDWRAMNAMTQFRTSKKTDPVFATWLRKAQPLARLKALREILDLDHLPEAAEKTITPHSDEGRQSDMAAASPAKAAGASDIGTPSKLAPQPRQSTVPPDGSLLLGRTHDRANQIVASDPIKFTRHAAFLGGTGSGKTTAALNIIEQALLQGIPAILVDRKGDLVTYARNEVWTAPPSEPSLTDRHCALREKLDVVVYTPGREDGNPVTLPVAPDHLHEMSSADRRRMALQAANSLGSMLGYAATGQGASRVSIMVKAIELLGEQPNQRIDLPTLIDYIQERDTALINAIGALDVKLFNRLIQDLQTLQINKENLFPSQGTPLNAEALLGLGEYARPGKTRLSIISTRSLGDLASVQFWVAQLLLELSRWMNKCPKSNLQAIALFDEADAYLPATRKPVSKQPMEDLLKRARSAGFGVFLATQSPGDFDYKCRDTIMTWFVGLITQKTSIEKMRPMLSEFKRNIEAELPGQKTGEFFFVRENVVTPVVAQRSAIDVKQVPDEEIIRIAARTRKDMGR